MKRIPLKSGDEQDVLTPARRYHKWRTGFAKEIKRRYNKRFRKKGKDLGRQQEQDYE